MTVANRLPQHTEVNNILAESERREALRQSLIGQRLFAIFGDGQDPQAPDSLEALQQGILRLRNVDGYRPIYYVHKSKKNRHCVRGCTINRGEEYYRRQPDGLKLCLECAAMLKKNFLQEMKLQSRSRTMAWNQWKMRNANKEHKCARGCVINGGEVYFLSGWGNYDCMKLCARCMAMVLYFNDVQALPSVSDFPL